MASKQLSVSEKIQIVLYNDCRLSLRDNASKLYHYHVSIYIFLKDYEESGNYHSKEGCDRKRKATASELFNILNIWPLFLRQKHSIPKRK